MQKVAPNGEAGYQDTSAGLPILWVASYPKSGNTWVRHILNETISPEVGGHISVPFLARELPTKLYTHDIPVGRLHFLKTHSFPGSAQLIDLADRFYGAITIRRHPLDILLSAINYNGLKSRSDCFLNGRIKSVEQIIADREIDHYIEEFKVHEGVPSYAAVSGPWTLYQARWNEVVPEDLRLSLIYEHMVSAPDEAILRISSFLGLDLTPAKAAEIAQNVERKTELDGKFYWRKRAYNFRSLLQMETIRKFEAYFAQELESLGYESTHESQVTL